MIFPVNLGVVKRFGWIITVDGTDPLYGINILLGMEREIDDLKAFPQVGEVFGFHHATEVVWDGEPPDGVQVLGSCTTCPVHESNRVPA